MVLASPPCSVSQRFPTVPTVPRYLSLSPRHNGRSKRKKALKFWLSRVCGTFPKDKEPKLKGFRFFLCRIHRQPECTRAGGKCQSGGVKNVQRIHATIVKSITPMPINIPAHNKVKIIVSIICFALL